jgi:probable rRNA maturation factor
MEVLIDNRQKKYKISLKQIQQKAKVILNALDCPEAELSILIVDDPQIAVFNQQYLNRKGPTNVIAFPMRAGPYANITPQLLGDVLISVETADREGKRVGISMEERFTQLLVHGILHLLGYDHETSDEDAQEMEEKSNEILNIIDTNACRHRRKRGNREKDVSA